MADLFGFDATQVKPSQAFTPLPVGDYLAVIIESEARPNKKNKGTVLHLTLEILDGQFKHRRVLDWLNIENPSATAEQIAKAKLSAICHAVGVLKPTNSSELHNIPLLIRVGCKHRTDTGEIVNEIKGYFKKEQSAPPARHQAGLGDTPPWERN